MKKFIFIFLTLIYTHNLWAIDTRIVGGGILEFSKGSVNGKPSWTDAEKAQLIQDYVYVTTAGYTLVVTTTTPTSTETNLSTCVVKFTDNSQWTTYQTKSGLLIKLKSLKVEVDLNTELNVTDADLTNRYNWLKSYYQSLP